MVGAVVVYIATKNAGKVREFREILATYGWTAAVFAGYADVAEGDACYAENAARKARTLHAQLRASGIAAPALGDDSGLEVAALGGRPGVLSARYGGEGASWAERRRQLLDDVRGAPDRSARFVCALHLVAADDTEVTAHASVDGEIAAQERGDGGFSYDAVFALPGPGATFAELSESAKNAVSHRARAVEFLVEALRGAAGNDLASGM